MQFLELNWFEHGLRVVMAWICSLLYPLISWIYELFMYLSKVNLLDNTMVKPIYQRVTVILSIIMVFYVTFEFVKYVIQPDNITDKEKGAGKLIYKLIAVILLIAFVPNIFGWGYEAQRIVVEQNIIGKLINGHKKVDGVSEGRNFASNMLANFYKKTSSNMNCDEAGITCSDLVDYNIISLQKYGNLPFLTMGLKETYEVSNQNDLGNKIEQPAIYFNGLFAVLVGGFVFYILVLYCIDVGTRWAQLIFLQVIAPIPIIGFLAPAKDGIFQKWTKQCLTTYLDIFIRVAIINYVILLSGSLLNPENLNKLFINIEGAPEEMKLFITLALVMGLLMFAQKAPKLLGELFPKMGAASGEFGLSGKARGLDKLGRVAGRVAGGAVGGAAGALAGMATGIGQGLRRSKALKADGTQKGFIGGAWGATKGAIGGVIGGTVRGMYHGSKNSKSLSEGVKNSFAGAKKQKEVNQRFGNRQENGYTFGHQVEDIVRSTVGAKSRVDVKEGAKAMVKRQQDAYSNLIKANDNIRDYAWKKAQDGKSPYIASYKQVEGREKQLMEKSLTELGFTNESQRVAALEQCAKDKKKYKDMATDDYIAKEQAKTSDKDKGLENMILNRDAELDNYNQYASADRKISTTTTENITYTDKITGLPVTIPAGTEIATLDPTALDEYNKKLKNKEAEVGREYSDIAAEEEAIKRETEGSGINDGKK